MTSGFEEIKAYIVLGDIAFGFHEGSGEVIAAESNRAGEFDWENAGICDRRGIHGPHFYVRIRDALRELKAAEDIVREMSTL